MGRLTITNDRAMHLWALERNKRAGFVDFDTDLCGSVFIAAHRKKRNPVGNFVRFENGDLIASAGTLVYEGSIGSEALGRLYRGFNGDVDGLRENAMGNFFVAIMKNGGLCLFLDKYEGLMTYYTIGASRWIVSNSLATVAGAISLTGKQLSLNRLAILEDAFVGAVIGEDTIFEEVHKLTGADYGAIDPEDGSIRTVAIPYERAVTPPAEKTMERMASKVAGLLREKLNVLQNNFAGNVSIHATGGMDNRLILAGLLANGVKPRLIHGVGSRIGTQPEDLLVLRTYANALALSLEAVDWREDIDDGPSRYGQWFSEFGFFGTLGHSKGFFDSFATGAFGGSGLHFSGLFIEMIRMSGALDRSRQMQGWFSGGSFSPAQFMEFYLARFNSHARHAMCVPYEEFYEYLQTKIEENAIRFGVSKTNGRFPGGSFQLLYDPWVRSAHPPWENFVNEFTCLVSLFNTADLHELAFEIPFDWRVNNRFALQVLNQLYPELLEFPFFSHGRRVMLRRRPLELREPMAAEFAGTLLQLMEGNRVTRAIRSIARPLRLGRAIFALDGTLREDRRNRRGIGAGVPAAGRGDVAKDARIFVDDEQQKAGERIIDPWAFGGDVRDLLKCGKLLQFVRKIREEPAAPENHQEL